MAKAKKAEEPVVETKSEGANERRSAKAVARYLRISPRKLRAVIDAIRFKPAHKAFALLTITPRKGARMAEKVLKSAVANAKDVGLEVGKLYISDVRADDGPTMKRFRPRSMGRADRILKRMSHLSLVVTEGKHNWGGSAPAEAEAQEETKPAKTKKGAEKKKTAKAAKAKG